MEPQAEVGAARLATPRVETARLVALGVPAERAAGVARFISSLPPHTRTGFELAYAYVVSRTATRASYPVTLAQHHDFHNGES